MKLTAAKTVEGHSVKIAVKDGKVHVDNATVVRDRGCGWRVGRRNIWVVAREVYEEQELTGEK